MLISASPTLGDDFWLRYLGPDYDPSAEQIDLDNHLYNREERGIESDRSEGLDPFGFEPPDSNGGIVSFPFPIVEVLLSSQSPLELPQHLRYPLSESEAAAYENDPMRVVTHVLEKAKAKLIESYGRDAVSKIRLIPRVTQLPASNSERERGQILHRTSGVGPK